MTRIFLLDDDKAITDMLKRIIEQTESGIICGSYNSPAEALENLNFDNPDLVLCDLLMPDLDGINFVKEARRLLPSAAFIMLSQVSDKQLMGEAYNAGVEFFISKPINSVEVVSVIQNVREKQKLKETVSQVSQLLNSNAAASPSNNSSHVTTKNHEESSRRLCQILAKIGIMGKKGADDIIKVCEYYFQHEDQLKEIKLKDICAYFSDSPKSMEQRIRRAAALGMTNMANLGIEDYYNDTFATYASSLFGFDQIRIEMNYIQGKSEVHGNVKIRHFISSLVYASIDR